MRCLPLLLLLLLLLLLHADPSLTTQASGGGKGGGVWRVANEFLLQVGNEAQAKLAGLWKALGSNR